MYKKKQNLTLQIYECELYNMSFFGSQWTVLKSQILDKLSNIVRKKYDALNRKMEKFSNNNNSHSRHNIPEQSNSFEFHEPIKNLTNVEFSYPELNHIQKAHKSNFNKAKLSNQIDNLIVETEYIIQNSNINDKNSVRYEIKQKLDKYIGNSQKTQSKKRNDFDYNTLKTALDKIKNHDLTVGKADKGNIITIESKEQKNQKTLSFLDNLNYTKLKSDPTNRFQN